MPVKLSPVEEAIITLSEVRKAGSAEWVEVSADGPRPASNRDGLWWALRRRGFEVKVEIRPTLGLAGYPNPSIVTLARWPT